jgi:hypothetical protein
VGRGKQDEGGGEDGEGGEALRVRVWSDARLGELNKAGERLGKLQALEVLQVK